MRVGPGRATACLIAALLLSAEIARAQSEETQQGWHTVRPGDTLRAISAKYLGSEESWVELWKLNPEIGDPDYLFPGQRVKVLQAPARSVPTARVGALSGRAQQRPAPIPWSEARRDNLLLEEDGVRTFQSSSLEMSFIDGTSVVLTEDSLVYLRRTGRTLTGAEKKSVEIVQGQAEIEAHAEPAADAAVEILVGETRAVSHLGDTGVAQARARRADDSTKVMVYEGSGEVVNAGATVELPRGTGSSVPVAAPPSPPEKLLPAPAVTSPPADSRWNYPNPPFGWQPVAGAASYTLEVCRDPGCRELVRRILTVREPEWRGSPLPVARLYWRVSAVSPSGLDGYPSAATPFDILSDRLDATPPAGTISLVGRQVTIDGVEYREAATRVVVEVTDEISGVAGWTATVNGREVEPGELDGPWPSGTYAIEVTAVDLADNRATLPAVSFRVDRDGPELELRVGGRDLLTELFGPRLEAAQDAFVRALPPWAGRRLRPRRSRVPWWTVLAWGHEASPLREHYLPRQRLWEVRGGFSQVVIQGDRPELLLGLPGLEVEIDGERRRLSADEVLWLAATDAHGAVRWLEVRGRPRDGDKPPGLEVTAGDAVGNHSELSWSFRAAGE